MKWVDRHFPLGSRVGQFNRQKLYNREFCIAFGNAHGKIKIIFGGNYMSKNYIQFSKELFDEIAGKACDTNIKLIEVESWLKSISRFINLTDEEIEIIDKANSILLAKTEKIEGILEDENNEFYNAENDDSYDDMR